MWVNSMLMTRDNPSIATNVNTMTSSVIILLLRNARLGCLCHRSVRQTNNEFWGGWTYAACVPVLVRIEDSFQPLFEVPRVRAIFSEPDSRDHKVTSSKPVLVSVLFRRLPSFWDRPRETSEGQAVVQCKIARWYASKTFPMELLVRELVSSSRSMSEKDVSQLLILQWQCVQYLGLL